MIIYCFYYRNPEFSDSVPILYAYTDNKEFAKEFESQRDHDNFFLIKKHITKSEFEEYNKTIRNLKIQKCSFYTKSFVYGRRVPVQVLSTWKEEDTILHNGDNFWAEFEKYLFDCKIFKSEYIRALEKLNFVKFYGFYRIKSFYNCDDFYEPYYTSFGPVDGLISEELRSSYQYDDLQLFLHFFGHLFNKRG